MRLAIKYKYGFLISCCCECRYIGGGGGGGGGTFLVMMTSCWDNPLQWIDIKDDISK